MPEQAEGFNPIGELLTIPVPKAQPDRKHVVEHYEDPAEHVGCMQTGDRVVNSKKCTVLGLVGGESFDVSHVQRDLFVVAVIQSEDDGAYPWLAADVLVDALGSPHPRMGLDPLVPGNAQGHRESRLAKRILRALGSIVIGLFPKQAAI